MTTHYKEHLLQQSLAVRTTVLPEVRKVIETVKPDFDSVKKYQTSIIDWLKPLVNLTDFYVYPMNGITQGLDWWYANENRSVYMEEGDYQWITPKGNMYEDSIKYVSVPSAIDGNFIDIPTGCCTAVDLAYVGSTIVKKIEIPKDVEYVFYSLSKPFGIRNIRTGWYFTRTPDEKLDALVNSAKYYNYYANDVSEAIISNFDVDFIHNSLYNKQKKICNDLSIVPSDSVWLATSTSEEYSKFRRSKDTARLCLAGIYNEQEKLT